MLELGSRQNMTGMETQRARGKCIANALFVSFAELSCVTWDRTSWVVGIIGGD